MHLAALPVSCGRDWLSQEVAFRASDFAQNHDYFHTKRVAKPLDPQRATGAVFISPEEQSSRRREQQGAINENRQRNSTRQSGN